MQSLRDVRRDHGLTQGQLAELVGVTESQLSRIEAGCNASVATAIAIEAWSGRAIAAESLSEEVALARRNMRAA